MARLYLLIFIVGIIGIVGYGAKYYYDTTQNRIAVLTKNNTTLKVAIETSEKSINNLKVNILPFEKLNNNQMYLKKEILNNFNKGNLNFFILIVIIIIEI